MKNAFLLLLFSLVFIISCRGNDDEVQQVDQVLNIYYKDAAGRDLLSADLPDSYSAVQFLDLNGERDLVPITSFTIQKNTLDINYIEYLAGAVRVPQDTTDANNKIYRSDFIVNLSRKTADTIDQDTVKIEYVLRPDLFQVSKFFYNGRLQFSKTPGQPNVINITK